VLSSTVGRLFGGSRTRRVILKKLTKEKKSRGTVRNILAPSEKVRRRHSQDESRVTPGPVRQTHLIESKSAEDRSVEAELKARPEGFEPPATGFEVRSGVLSFPNLNKLQKEKRGISRQNKPQDATRAQPK